MHQLLGELLRIAVADLVVQEHHAAHAGQVRAAGLHHAAAAVLVAFRSAGDLPPHALFAGVLKSSARKMSVRAEDGRQLSRAARGTIEIARDEEAGQALEVDLLDGVVALIDAAMDHRIQRRRRGHRPQSQRDEHGSPHHVRSLLPLLGRRRGHEVKIPDFPAERPEPRVGRQLARRQHARRCGEAALADHHDSEDSDRAKHSVCSERNLPARRAFK